MTPLTLTQIAELRTSLMKSLFELLGFNDKDGTYIYSLGRVKEAFHVGTMSLDDFTEIDEEFVGEIADCVLRRIAEFAAESELRLRERVEELEWQKVLLINSLGFIRQRSTTGLRIEGLDSFIDTVLEDPIFHEALDHVSTP